MFASNVSSSEHPAEQGSVPDSSWAIYLTQVSSSTLLSLVKLSSSTLLSLVKLSLSSFLSLKYYDFKCHL